MSERSERRIRMGQFQRLGIRYSRQPYVRVRPNSFLDACRHLTLSHEHDDGGKAEEEKACEDASIGEPSEWLNIGA